MTSDEQKSGVQESRGWVLGARDRGRTKGRSQSAAGETEGAMSFRSRIAGHACHFRNCDDVWPLNDSSIHDTAFLLVTCSS